MGTQLVEVASLEPSDDLSDEQVNALLARATERLRAKASSQQLIQPENTRFVLQKLDAGELPEKYVSSKHGVAKFDAARLLDKEQRKLDNGVRKVEDPVAAKKFALEKKKATAGDDWFDLPRTNLTPELKRDLQLLKMRNALDPHRHYKKSSGRMKPPMYSQVGTVIEGPTEFYSNREKNRDRKRTFAEEVMATEKESGRFKRKYNEIQARKTSGKKAFYKALQAKRKGGVKKGGNT